MRSERRAFVSALARHAGAPSHHFLWRRVHCTLECGRARRESQPRFESAWIDESELFTRFNAATADRAGEVVNVRVLVYAVSTYLPAVPIGPHRFDFEIEAPRLVTDLTPADVVAIYDDERAFLAANPWTEPLPYLARVEPTEPRLVQVADEHYRDRVDALWCVGEVFDNTLLCDGNRRFGLGYRTLREPLYGGKMYPDLAAALLAAAWR